MEARASTAHINTYVYMPLCVRAPVKACYTIT